MTVVWIIFAIVLALGALALVFVREMLAPLSAYLAMVCLWFANLLPLNATILLTWLFITVIVMGTTMLQSPEIRVQTRGLGYLLGGSIAGMAIGLLGYSLATDLSMLYGLMIVGTVAGTFFGFLLFGTTPAGRGVSIHSGHFFSYLLAKGFPVAVTVMQIGIILVLTMAVKGVAIE